MKSRHGQQSKRHRDQNAKGAPGHSGKIEKKSLSASHPASNAPIAPIQSTSPREWLFAILLLVATLVAYLPGMRGKFLWDDDSWTSVIEPLLRDWSGLGLIWFKPTAMQQYYPLTGTTFWLDYHLWGFHTTPYHVENVLFHAVAAILFWRLLRRLQVPGAWLGGAIVALHPIMVESTAWITERKNVLSLVLYLGALLVYARFARFWEDNPKASDTASPRSWRLYAIAFLLFAAACLAKVTALSLPAVLLLICWWKSGRIRWRSDALPVVPFFAFAMVYGLLIAWLEKNHVGAAGQDFAISFPERCLVAGRALWFYAGKVFWPANLCFVYPRWQPDARSLAQWLYPITAVGALFALWFARGRIGRGPAAAVFFFAGTLFPVLGFLNAYGMRFSYVWDHWVYLSSLGLIALSAALVAQAAQRLRQPAALYGFAVIALPILTILTWRQSAIYVDPETLWTTTIARNPDAFLAYNNLGVAAFQNGQVDEAIAHYEKALARQPNYADAHNNLGEALLKKERLDEAVVHFQAAIKIEPNDEIAFNNLGAALLQSEHFDEAISCLKQAVILRPDYAEAHNNLGIALLQRALVEEAIGHFETAVKIRPDYTEAQNNLTHLAWVLATCPESPPRNGARAVDLARKVDQLSGGKDPAVLGTLAAAYAEIGQYPEAISAAQRALQWASAAKDTMRVTALQTQMAYYQKGLPYRDNRRAN